MKKLLLFPCLLLLKFSSYSQVPVAVVLEKEKKPTGICSDGLKWVDMKPPMAPGARMAVVEGNPKESGHFTIRVWFPPYYKIPPHVHPVDERTTVLSGSVYVGYGEVLDTINARKFTAGCFYFNPTGVHHYVFTSGEEAIIQISTTGPWGLSFLEAEDKKDGQHK